MQEYWEAYMKPMDGHAAMVSLNAGVADSVPDGEYMYVGFVKVKLNNPKEDGLVWEQEGDDVGFIEDRLEMESLRYRNGKYIGRIITQGAVNFIYALKMDFEWKNTVEDAMKHFPEYSYEFGSRIDSEWEVYQKLLFPTVKEWQIITNHHACDNLKEQGDDLQQARAIEHKSYFTCNDDREGFVQKIQEMGFAEQKRSEVPFRDETMYGISFYRKDKPFYYDIDALTVELIDVSEAYNGKYDGWECALVKPLWQTQKK
ncbi:DUF695 domain-containing protein [Sulfurimonas hydrogeniphila]|uniref:DUF695 domain-containing protein n=1 Tax=Sulfurimonas hydrogeniphila TaxID=2509341 RepID=UPI00125EB702|nr:DUF695 domain-containing protein [Sulfurimonas hydrogeniphila]